MIFAFDMISVRASGRLRRIQNRSEFKNLERRLEDQKISEEDFKRLVLRLLQTVGF